VIGSLNLNGLTIDSSGRVSFSGLSSGIDFQKVVDAIIAARQVPVDRLQTEVDARKEKIAAINELKSLLAALQTSVSKLYGSPSFGNTNDAFEAKSAFAATSRTDGVTPSAAASLVGVTLSNSAVAGSHTLEVLRVASAHKVASTSVASTSATLGAELGLADGSFDLNGETIEVFAADTILELRDRINAANKGANATGVTASVVSVGTSEHLLVLTADDTGAANEMTVANETGGVLASLGVSADGGASFVNELQVGLDARLKADGLKDLDRFETDTLGSPSVALSNYISTAPATGSFTVTIGGNAQVINYDAATDTLTSLRDDINTAFGSAVASIETDPFGARLVIDGAGSTVTTTDTNGLLADLGMDNDQVIVRSSNTVSDLFTGVTLSLYNAEEGTKITIQVEQDLAQVKGQIQGFVDAYNAVRQFINAQNATDPTTGLKSEEAGPLFASTLLRDVQSKIANLVGNGVTGVDQNFSVLAQAGIKFVNNAILLDPTLKDTLEIDATKLDNALLNNPADVRKLFGFDFSSSSPKVTLVGFSGKTAYNANGYTVNIAYEKSYDSDQIDPTTTFTQVDAETGGPASDGISAITFAESVASGNAFRYSYDSATEDLTVVNLTTGTSQTIDITAALDAVAGAGQELGAGETAAINFSNLGVTITLSGDAGFTRAADIDNGTLSTAGLDPGTTMTGGAVTVPASGMDKTTVDALIAAGAYNPATGLLTLGVTSSGAGEVHFDTAAGIKFAVDGGAVAADISATDLDDGTAHTVGVYVNDGTSDVLVGTVNFTTLASTAAGSGSVTIDLGTGLIAETSVTEDGDTAMSDYLAIADGSFEIHDGTGLLGTVNYLAGDSLNELATAISAINGVTATVASASGTFAIEIKSDTNDALTFQNDTGGLIAALNVTDKGDAIFSANIGGSSSGADDGSATVSGNTITATAQTGADGLQLFYSGNNDIASVDVNFTTGFASGLFFSLGDLLAGSGNVEAELDTLNAQNETADERIEQMLVRLEIKRDTLLAKFQAMELAMATANRILESIQASTDALFNNQNS